MESCQDRTFQRQQGPAGREGGLHHFKVYFSTPATKVPYTLRKGVTSCLWWACESGSYSPYFLFSFVFGVHAYVPVFVCLSLLFLTSKLWKGFPKIPLSPSFLSFSLPFPLSLPPSLSLNYAVGLFNPPWPVNYTDAGIKRNEFCDVEFYDHRLG